MTAIITRTSQTVETRLIDANGNEVETRYKSTLNEAIDYVASRGAVHVELEELNF